MEAQSREILSDGWHGTVVTQDRTAAVEMKTGNVCVACVHKTQTNAKRRPVKNVTMDQTSQQRDHELNYSSINVKKLSFSKTVVL